MLVGTFNQEKALVGAFCMIVQLHRLIVHSTSQEAAGEGGAVIAPVLALLLISAELLARLEAGQGHGLDNLVRVWLAAGHRDQGALGQGRGHQGGHPQQGDHRH